MNILFNKNVKIIVTMILLLLISLVFGINSYAAYERGGGKIYVKTLTVSSTSKTLYVGNSFKITAYISKNATNKKINWSSSKPSVASVSNGGYVTAKSAGTTIITVKATDGSGKYATCTVKVLKPKVTSIKLNKTKISVNVGSAAELWVSSVTPSGASKTVTWSTSNSKIATVNGGRVYGKGAGTAKITAKATDGSGKTATCTVTVVKPTIPVSSISVTPVSKNLYVGKVFSVFATLNPGNATNKTITWTSSNPSIAEVKGNGAEGVVTGKSAGTTKITAKSNNGKMATCTVRVEKISVNGITLNQSNMTLKSGQTSELKPTVTPANATYKQVVFYSDNPAVAKVGENSGIIIAQTVTKKGTARISAITKDGAYKAICTVTVVPKVPVREIKLNAVSIGVTEGYSTRIGVQQIIPSDATNKSVVFKSSNTSIVEVDNTGVVKAKKAGEAIITAEAADGCGAKIKCKVNVSPRPILPDKIKIYSGDRLLDNQTWQIYKGKSYGLEARITPSNSTNKSVRWSTTNPEIADIKEGKTGAILYCKSAGTVKILAEAINGKHAEFTAVIKEKATDFSVNPDKRTIYVPDTFKIEVNKKPNNNAVGTATFTSINPEIATVDKTGKVTAKRQGTAVINITMEVLNSKNQLITVKRTCAITVKETATRYINIETNKVALYLGETNTVKLGATINPTYNSITWTSSNPNVATVNNNGVVTGKSVGTVRITAKSADGKIKDTCEVKVLKANKNINAMLETMNQEIGVKGSDLTGKTGTKGEWCCGYVRYYWDTYGFYLPGADNYKYDEYHATAKFSCTSLMHYAMEKNIFEDRESEYQPQKGDLILFKTKDCSKDEAGHVGIVYSVDEEGNITTIEGNYNGGSSASSRKVGSRTCESWSWGDGGNILGYIPIADVQ